MIMSVKVHLTRINLWLILLIAGLFILGILFKNIFWEIAPAVILWASAGALFIIIVVVKNKKKMKEIDIGKQKEKDEAGLAVAIAKSYPRVSMAVLSEKLRKDARETERIFMNLIEADKIQGHFDAVTGDFISAMVKITQIGTGTQGFHCPHCGASITCAPIKGTSMKCDSCGELVVVT